MKHHLKRGSNTNRPILQDLLIKVIFLRLKEKDLLSENLTPSDLEKLCRVSVDKAAQSVVIEADAEVFKDRSIKQLDQALSKEDINEIYQIYLDIIQGATESASTQLLDTWIRLAPEVLHRERNQFDQFLHELNTIWGDTLHLLDILLGTTLQKGIEVYEAYSPNVAEKTRTRFDVINHLFGRACQVGQEIHVLLSQGYADGAEARWRTLYEITVIATFIMQNDDQVAHRYLAQMFVDDYKRVRAQREIYKAEGIEIISDEDFEKLKINKELILSHDVRFSAGDYGWAAPALNKSDKAKVTFSDIEEAVGLNYLRSAYKEACSNVHASAIGTYFRLGLDQKQRGILAGYSFFRIGDVARNTIFIILVLLENILSHYPSIENRVHVEAVYKLLSRATDAIHDAHVALNEKRKHKES